MAHTKEVLRWYPAKLKNTEAPFNRNPLFLLRLRSERALKRNKQDFYSPLSLPLSFSWKYHFLWGGVITEEHALRSPLHHKSSLPLELANEKLTVGCKMKRDFCRILAEENNLCLFDWHKSAICIILYMHVSMFVWKREFLM